MASSLDLFPLAPTEPDAQPRGPENVRRAMRVTTYASPCSTPWHGPPQPRCVVGGGDAPYSVDFGRRPLCRAHLPNDFWSCRDKAAAA
jgi:hypothetical protein